VASIQGIAGGSLLLLLVLAVKKREVLGLSFLRRMRKERIEGMVPRYDGINRD
jgi:hypothetical protein